MTILILLVLSSTHPSVTHIQFENETRCLEAIGKVLEFENSKKDLVVKARCVRQ